MIKQYVLKAVNDCPVVDGIQFKRSNVDNVKKLIGSDFVKIDKEHKENGYCYLHIMVDGKERKIEEYSWIIKIKPGYEIFKANEFYKLYYSIEYLVDRDWLR